MTRKPQSTSFCEEAKALVGEAYQLAGNLAFELHKADSYRRDISLEQKAIRLMDILACDLPTLLEAPKPKREYGIEDKPLGQPEPVELAQGDPLPCPQCSGAGWVEGVGTNYRTGEPEQIQEQCYPCRGTGYRLTMRESVTQDDIENILLDKITPECPCEEAHLEGVEDAATELLKVFSISKVSKIEVQERK